ncbi:uncharacterized protein CEXT_327571, partial [Caerostris extrusa]
KKIGTFEILQNNAKSKNVFEKVHKPHKRQSVLNSLFIRNISDVLSTGDVAPEVLGHGIEITCVKVSPCCKILNVYWQIPVGKFSDHENIATVLNMNAHKIRAELISRNVMGRVPQIFFVRDTTNSYLAAFEKALEEVEKEIIDDKNPGVVPDDSFYSKKKIFVFKNSKQENRKENSVQTSESVADTYPTKNANVKSIAPMRPSDMKSDVFGLKHDTLMKKVHALKNKKPEKSNVIVSSIDWDESGDLFCKIPGTSLHSDSDRDDLLKKFKIERKKLMREKRSTQKNQKESILFDSQVEYDEPEQTIAEDYIEEETPEKF